MMKMLGVATTVQELMDKIAPYRDYSIWMDNPIHGFNTDVWVDEDAKIIYLQ